MLIQRRKEHPGEHAKAITVSYRMWEGTVEVERTLDLPARWSVCPACRGEGVHVLVRLNEWSEQAEDLADGQGHLNHVRCKTCEGRTTVLVPDEDKFTDEQRELHLRRVLSAVRFSA